jgi:TRAP-type C4-dicarboxylate transport system permease small subunit
VVGEDHDEHVRRGGDAGDAAARTGLSRLLHLARRGAEAYASVITIGACAALVVATLHIFVDAISTKLFLTPIDGTFQLVTYYYMVALFFLPLGYAEAQDAHISADLVYSALPRRLRRVVATGNYVLLTLFLGFLTCHAAVKAIRQTGIGDYQEVADWQLLLWPSRWIAVAGLLAMLAVSALKAIDIAVSGPPDEREPPV